mmetsp:Transcript_92970/g.201050  ORF Transcript_92970/g.201050 Transcript_92970/m.201050 type:complete len:793 (-) Transcript_92970:7-2385(-)
MGCGQSSAVSDGNGSTKALGQGQKLLDEYVVGRKLGEGAFGVVSQCKCRANGLSRAVKMVDKVETPLKIIEEETRLMQALDHPNIVKCHGVYYERCFICIVMDLYQGGDMMAGMQSHFKTRGQVECMECTHLSDQMAGSIAYCHSKQIMHRDIKGDNYLLDRPDITDGECRVVLTDFGMACNAAPSARLSMKCGSEMYWAPEVYDRSYGMKVDVWALGVIMFGLVTARFPFKDEEDIRNKLVRIPRRVHPTCKDFIEVMLDKKEATRPTSSKVLQHPWVSAKEKKAFAQGNEHADSKTIEQHETDHHGTDLAADDVNEVIQERRQVLMARLEKEHERRTGVFKMEGSAVKVYSLRHQEAKFTITDKKNQNHAWIYEWWDTQKAESVGLLDLKAKAKPATPTTPVEASKQELDGFSHMLQEHNIDIAKFGVGKAKDLIDLYHEVKSGTASLMLDAKEHKKLVRVIDVVVLRICPEGQERFLVETEERFPDGRMRTNNFLPGEKKEPYENTQEAAKRILRDFLGMAGHEVLLNMKTIRRIEEERPSPSYPGVVTVYRKDIIDAVITTKHPDELKKIGLPVSGEGWSQQDSSGNTKFFMWMTEGMAKVKGVKLTLGEENISTLVQAPIGFKEEPLRNHLLAHNIDVAQFGKEATKSLKQFSTELMQGEATLAGDTRIVDNVLVIITRPETGQILVQTGHTQNGKTTALQRLPGFKHRPDENQYTSAKRMCNQRLHIDGNQVSLDPQVMMVEGEKLSPSYPGLRTVYRSWLISATLADIVSKDAAEGLEGLFKITV